MVHTSQPRRVAADVAASPWGAALVRFGIGARGVVYLVIGYLALRIALGATGDARAGTRRQASGQGAVRTLESLPAGHAVLAVLAIGLVGYALFSLLDAIRHHDTEHPAAKKWADRALSLWGTALYLLFFAWTLSILFTAGGGGGQGDTEMTARVLHWPLGRLLVAAAGVVFVVSAGVLVRRAVVRGFENRFDRDSIGDRAWRVLVPLGVIGCLARALAFGLIGGMVVSAAITFDAQHGTGLDGSLRTLATQWYGPYLLFPIALGLIVFAVYLGFEAQYRRV